MGGLGCDNMSVILACLLQDGESYSDLCQRCVSFVPQPSSPRDTASSSWSTSNARLLTEDYIGMAQGGAWSNGLGITASVNVETVGRQRNSSSSSSEGERSTDIDEELSRSGEGTLESADLDKDSAVMYDEGSSRSGLAVETAV